MGGRVVDGQVSGGALQQGSQWPQFVDERDRVCNHLRIGDQPGLQFTPPDPDLRDAADKPMQRKPVQSLLHDTEPNQHSAVNLKSVVTTLLGLLLLMPYALPVMV